MRLLALLLLAVSAFAAEEFKGTWTSSSNDAGGALYIKLDTEPAVSFTLQGQDVKTKVLRWTLDKAGSTDRKFSIEYRFTLGDTDLVSHLAGTINGAAMEGKYESKAGESPVDGGTFKAEAVK